MKFKPRVKLSGTNGNVFSIIGKVVGALKDAGKFDDAKAFNEKALKKDSYGGVLRLAFKYADVV